MNKITDWFLRLVKGVFVGTAFIMPGISGGVLAAIFGLYSRLVGFIAHPMRDFKKNILFFLPVGIGMLVSIVLLSYPMNYFFDNFMAPTMWFFIGAVAGTVPALWKESGLKGRKPKHFIIMLISFAAFFAFLKLGSSALNGQTPENFGTWTLAGALIALGILVPGFSPSNFLLYMGMYNSMLVAFKQLDLTVLAPLGLGLLGCLLLFSKLVDMLFRKAYAGLYHVVLGAVAASTLMIVPLDYNYLSLGALVCLVTCAAGVALGLWMSKLEEKYK